MKNMTACMMALLLFFGHIMPSGNPSKDMFGLLPSLVRCNRAMLANFDTPRPPLPPAKAILHQIDLATGRGDLQAETRKVGVPQIGVFVSGPERVNSPLVDLARRHDSLLTC